MTNLLKKALLPVALLFAHVAFSQNYAAGLEAMQLENWDKAISIFSGLVKADPTDQSSFLSLGNAYLAKGNKEMAMTQFKAAYGAKSDAPMAYVANGRVMLLQNNTAEADKQFAKAKKYGKKDMVTRRQIGESYFYYIEPSFKKPNLARAEEYLTDALSVSTKDFDLQMALGTCFREMSNGGSAAQHYEYAEVLQPQNPLPKLMIAKVYRIAKVKDKPVLFYNKAIQVEPSYTPALRGKAEYYFFVLYNYEEATKAYEQLVEKGAEVKIEDEMQLANCYYLTKDCINCSALVEKILQKDPTKNYLRRLQAYCDYDNGNYANGLKVLNEYFASVTSDKILPSDYEFHAKFLLQTQGDTTQAIRDYKKVIEMDSSKWTLYEEVDKLEWVRRDYCAALTAYKTYLDSVETPRATDWYNLGLRHYFCREDSMNYQNAEMAFAKVTESNPDAGIGWLWAAKSAKRLDPEPDSIAVHPELANEYGKALKYYEPFIVIAEKDVEKNKKDLLEAYFYAAYCYFVKNDTVKFNAIANKWQALESNADQLKTIADMRAAFGKEFAPGGKNK